MSIVLDGDKGVTQNTTEAARLPSGTTAERPANPVAGMIRFNTDEGYFEGYTGFNWFSIASIDLSPLLIQAPDATAAYSLRKLNNANVPVVRVRRNSDNSEQDFMAGEIQNGSLEDFCGFGDGFVAKWYDQSGNANHASQVTASSQPKIVDAGVLVKENGRPVLDFDGVDDFLDTNANLFDGLTSYYLSSVLTPKSFTFNGYFSEAPGGVGNRTAVFHSGNGFQVRHDAGAGVSLSTSGNVNESVLFTVFYDSTQINLAINGDIKDGSSYTSALVSNSAGFVIAARRPTADCQEMAISELIVYSDDQASNRNLIETNINTYYGIY